MAQISITVGPLTVSRSAPDAKALAVLNNYAAAIGATGTNRERGEAILDALISYIQDVAREQRRRQAQADGIAAAQDEIDSLGWRN